MKNYILNHPGKGFAEFENFLNKYNVDLDNDSFSVLFDEILESNSIEYFQAFADFDESETYCRGEGDVYQVNINVAVNTSPVEFELIGYTTDTIPYYNHYNQPLHRVQ